MLMNPRELRGSCVCHCSIMSIRLGKLHAARPPYSRQQSGSAARCLLFLLPAADRGHHKPQSRILIHQLSPYEGFCSGHGRSYTLWTPHNARAGRPDPHHGLPRTLAVKGALGWTIWSGTWAQICSMWTGIPQYTVSRTFLALICSVSEIEIFLLFALNGALFVNLFGQMV